MQPPLRTHFCTHGRPGDIIDSMTEIGKIMVVGGLLLAVVGAGLWALGRSGFRGLPGDVRVETESVGIYLPIVTCLVLSVVLTALIWLWQWLGRR